MPAGHRLAQLALGACALFLLAGCSARPPQPGAVRYQPPRDAPVRALDLSREPEVRILLVQAVSAVEVRAEHGIIVIDERGRRLAEYGGRGRLHLFQRPGHPERLELYSEVRRGRRLARAALKKIPFKRSVILQPAGGGALAINGKVYRGRVRLLRQGAHFNCINLVPLELYLRGVVPHEIGKLRQPGFEAMRTQAVISRNYALQRLQEGNGKHWDMVDTVYDQVYHGAAGEWELANRAIESTRGEVLWAKGDLAEVYYASTCGGATTAIDEVWRHGPVEHLVSIRDADPHGKSWCRGSRYFRWRHSWSARELGEILRAWLPQAAGLASNARVGRLVDLGVTKSTPEGRAKELTVVTDSGTFRVFGDRIRTALKRDMQGNALRSIMFRLAKERDAHGRLTRVRAIGAGWGHGIGLCQVGAIARSKAGDGYREILGAYYPGTAMRRLYR